MTISADRPAARSAIDPVGARPRPRVHFTAGGWINDPFGITWAGDRYLMFYQALPERTTWSAECTWGTAESIDLVGWRELPPALEPRPFEIGCWSGSATLDTSPPRLFYTRIAGATWADGVVATATGDVDLASWSSSIEDVVVPGPPAELGVTTFRDPFVFRHGEEWVMLVGAGLADGRGAAVQFRSDDLVTWSCDGLLASRSAESGSAGVATGQVWECPQLFALDDEWVLLVSVWDDDELYHVAAALGDYDGHHFHPRTWQQLTHGSSAYAMTAFADRDGRRCVLSWLREEPRNDPARLGWAGAHSVAALVAHGPHGRLVLSPHPDLAACATPEPPPGSVLVDGGLHLPITSGAAEITMSPVAGTTLVLVAETGELGHLEFGDARLTISRPALAPGWMPIDSTQPLVVLFDADIVEVFGPGGYGAFRIGSAQEAASTELVISPAPLEVSLRVF